MGGLDSVNSTSTSLFADAVKVAKDADHVVLFLGLDNQHSEGEGHDRHDIGLPPVQLALFDAIRKVGRPVIVVLLNGGVVAASSVKEHASAIVEAWYPGFF